MNVSSSYIMKYSKALRKLHRWNAMWAQDSGFFIWNQNSTRIRQLFSYIKPIPKISSALFCA
jgi:hypothetical protein